MLIRGLILASSFVASAKLPTQPKNVTKPTKNARKNAKKNVSKKSKA